MGCFVGIDVGKNNHDYAVVDDAEAKLVSGEFAGDAAGFKKLRNL